MAKKIKKFKVGMDSETYAISMVEEPAIESDFVALADQKEEIYLSSNDERHMCYGAALIPEKDIYRNNGEQEYYITFSKESIEKMSQDFMKNYRQNEVTLDHDEMANDITITESWLVEDSYKDKANALGINVPVGTWMIGMKVNQIDVWERVKNGELKGFSVESMVTLEDFNKQNNIFNMDEMKFWSKMREIIKEAFSKEEKSEIEELAANSGLTVEAYVNEVEAERQRILDESLEMLEEETPTEPTVEAPTTEEPAQETPATEEPKVEEPAQEEPTVEEPITEEPNVETPPVEDKRFEELINSLKDEINALKEMNNGLNDKIKELSKEPSIKPVNTNAKNGGNGGSTYDAWREQLRQMVGY